jgi:hypothetical protein
MNLIRTLLAKIPSLLSSTPSIFVFIFLFVYLFGLGVVGLFVQSVEPSSNVQLVFGNYTNVLSALGAALAAGAGAKHTESFRKLHDKHDKLQETLDAISERLARIENKK